MKTLRISAVSIVLLVIIGSLTACSSSVSNTTNLPAATSPAAQNQSQGPASVTPATSPTIIPPPPPGWVFANPEDQKRWEENKTFAAKSLEEASRFVGYQIAVPSFLPEGFQSNGFVAISQLGGGLPEGMRPKFIAVNVDQMWSWAGNKQVMILFTQSQHSFGVGGEQSVIELGGIPVTRSVTQSEPPRPNVGFSWERDGRYYVLVGYLGGPLDESVLIKVFNSLYGL